MDADTKRLAYWYMSLLDGDTHNIDTALKHLKEWGYINEDSEWEYDE